jgi:hypothetical protein
MSQIAGQTIVIHLYDLYGGSASSSPDLSGIFSLAFKSGVRRFLEPTHPLIYSQNSGLGNLF